VAAVQSKYFTIVIVPDSKSQFKQLRVSRRMIRGFIGGTVFTLLSLALFAVSYVDLYARSHRVDASIRETKGLESKLAEASKQLAQAMASAELARRNLSETLRNQQKQLSDLRSRSEHLSKIIAAREVTAHAYARILREQSFWEKLNELSTKFIVSVLAGLVTVFILFLFKMRRFEHGSVVIRHDDTESGLPSRTGQTE
jgi:hypothetical protein